jgi:Protein of unknown function (DUF2997)
MATEIILDFAPDGEVKMEGKGFQGKSCDEAMSHFEKALGEVSNRKNKPEYFQGVRTDAKQKA